jgi:hypothetical protein
MDISLYLCKHNHHKEHEQDLFKHISKTKNTVYIITKRF